MGITFIVYGEQAGTEKIFVLNMILLLVPANEWVPIEGGLRQRVHTLNVFINDIYHEQKILRSTSAFEMYRKRFQQISPDRIVEFLVLDREFPRAIIALLLRRRP